MLNYHALATLARIEMEERQRQAERAQLLRLTRAPRPEAIAQLRGWSWRLVRPLGGAGRRA
jgi:hypothetical protein